MFKNSTCEIKKNNSGNKQEILKSKVVLLVSLSVTLITFATIVTSILLQEDLNFTIAVQGTAALAMVAGDRKSVV